jgi:hypothetical protein
MRDAAVSLVIFLAICIGLAFLLWGLSAWARQWRKIRSGRDWNRWLLHKNRQNCPEITGSDLEAEAANAECGIYPLTEHIRHRNKFRGRHYDAA